METTISIGGANELVFTNRGATTQTPIFATLATIRRYTTLRTRIPIEGGKAQLVTILSDPISGFYTPEHASIIADAILAVFAAC